MGTTPGTGYYSADYLTKEGGQWNLLSKGHGLAWTKLYDDMVGAERFQEQEVSAEKKSEIMSAYPNLIPNVELLDTMVDMPTMNGKDYGTMTLANAIQALNAHTWEERIEGTLRTTEENMTGDNIRTAIQRLIGTVSTNQAAVEPVVQTVAATGVNDGSTLIAGGPQTNDAVTQVATVVEPVVEPAVTTGFDAMVKALPINTTKTEANKKGNGRTYYESPEFDMSTKEGREEKKKYDQWRFKNMKDYRRLGIEIPTSKIKRS